MKIDAIKKTVVEMKRLRDAIESLAKTDEYQRSNLRHSDLYRSPESAAVRRASMDLTRALAKMRRSGRTK